MTGKHTLFRIFLSGLALSITHVGCGQNVIVNPSSSASDYGTSASATTSTVVGGTSTELNLADSSGVKINVSDSDSIVLMLVGLSPNGQTQGMEVDTSESAASKDLSRFTTMNNNTDDGDDDITESVHALLREHEAEISDNAPLPDPSQTRFATKKLSIGDARSFNVVSDFTGSGAYTSVNAELVYNGVAFDLYVDTRDKMAFDTGDIQTLAENFESIIPHENDLFGTESDVDDDGRFNVLMTREVNLLGQKYGGLVTGYFYASDLFDTTTYAGSNQTELIYTLVPDPKKSFGTSSVPYGLTVNNILPGVFVHEYQHMINFNQHYFESSNSPEASWLNEGLSHLAEDLYSIDANNYMPSTGLENPSRVARYLKNIDQTCFACGSNLQQRGGTYLFLRYLYEQAELGNIPHLSSGADLIEYLLDGSNRDVHNISYALTGDASDVSAFEDALAHFGLALYLSNTGQALDDNCQFTGLNLRDIQNDNRNTLLSGPAITSMDQNSLVKTLTGYSIAYVQISGQVINQAGGRVNLSMENSKQFKTFLIQ